MATRLVWTGGALLLAVGVAACGRELRTDFERHMEARLLAAELTTQFARAADSTTRVVLANTSDAASAGVREADQAASGIALDSKTLLADLEHLGYTPERRLLDEFTANWTRYHELSQSIVTLAMESTNVKAQRLSFGAGRDAADAVEAELKYVRPASSADEWKVRALASTAMAAVREIQALQAPHIAEADDARMTALESRMAAAQAAATSALASLAGSASAASATHVTAARQAFDRVLSVNRELISLSRRNSNVHALAMSMGQARVLAAACEESLHALADALAQRSASGATR